MKWIFQRGAEIDAGDQLPAASLLFAADPFFVGAGRDLDDVWHPVGVMAGADEIFEALRLAANVSDHLPQDALRQ